MCKLEVVAAAAVTLAAEVAKAVVVVLLTLAVAVAVDLLEAAEAALPTVVEKKVLREAVLPEVVEVDPRAARVEARASLRLDSPATVCTLKIDSSLKASAGSLGNGYVRQYDL